MARLAEQLEIIHRSWTEGPFTFTGRHYTVRDLDAQPRPLQRPHPRLLMGGVAGPRAARLAARWADEYNTAFASPEQVRERKTRIGAACEAAGREPIPFPVMPPLGARGVDPITEHLLALRDAGADRVMLQHLAHTDLDAVAMIGRELAPRLA